LCCTNLQFKINREKERKIKKKEREKVKMEYTQSSSSVLKPTVGLGFPQNLPPRLSVPGSSIPLLNFHFSLIVLYTSGIQPGVREDILRGT
jgi:S-adenosylmethionine:tRNA-ribosyltransferase-isomerase (queuine synthetase)